MKLAFLYAGQGSQTVGMGQDFYENYPQVRSVFESTAAGFDIKDLCFRGPAEKLTQTRYTQPCMAAFAVAVTKLLHEEGITPSYAAGLSLGEYSALYAAGVLGEDTLIKTLAYRGQVMEETTTGIDAQMVAVLGLSDDKIAQAVANVDPALGVVACANFNCPGQVVIGGNAAAVNKAAQLCKEYGAKRCLPLAVSGPFHTPLMEKASVKLQEYFKRITWGTMTFPVLFNTTADILPVGRTVAEMLTQQVKSPVLFEKTIQKLEQLGVDTIIEIGPGRVLSGFVKKTAPGIKTYAIEDVDSFLGAVRALKGVNI